MDQKVIEILKRPVEIHTKPGGGGKDYKYVKGSDVISRLNEAFDHEWSTEVRSVEIVENQVIVHLRLMVGDIYHESFGGAEIQRFSQGPRKGQAVDISSAYKAAVTNSIKKISENLGIGLDFEDNSDSSVNMMVPKNVGMKKGPVPQKPPVSSSTTISTTKNPDIAIMAQAAVEKALKQKETIITDSENSLASTFDENKPPTKPEKAPSTDPFGAPVEDGPINDIQKHAVKALMGMTKKTFEEAKLAALKDSSANGIDDLKKSEAAAIIQYLNTANSVKGK